MSKEDNSGPEESRAGIINTVQEPLGFFVLVVLVVEAILGLIVGFGDTGDDRTLIIKGMLAMIGGLILIVAFIAFLRPRNLYRPVSSETGPSDNLNKKTNIEGIYHAGEDYKYKVKINRLTGDYYRVFNPDDWEGAGFFDGEFYYGVFKMNHKASPRERRGNWGAHRARLRPDGSFDLFGIELTTENLDYDRFEVDPWNKDNVQ